VYFYLTALYFTALNGNSKALQLLFVPLGFRPLESEKGIGSSPLKIGGRAQQELAVLPQILSDSP